MAAPRRSPQQQPGVPEVVPTAPNPKLAAIRQQIQAKAELISEAGTIDSLRDLYSYSDPKTGLSTSVEAKVATSDEIQHFEKVYPESTFGQGRVKHAAIFKIKVQDKDGRSAGEFKQVIFMDDAKNLGVLHDNADMNPAYQGQGFGSRFEEQIEANYRQLGVKSIVRGCSEVGRYEAAKNGFDFLLEEDRQSFIQSFEKFLRQQGLQKFQFKGKTLELGDIKTYIRTPQDILATSVGKPVTATHRIVRKFVGQPDEITFEEHQYPGEKLGKAFFFDENAQVKETRYPNATSRGYWMGIKHLAA